MFLVCYIYPVVSGLFGSFGFFYFFFILRIDKNNNIDIKSLKLNI